MCVCDVSTKTQCVGAIASVGQTCCVLNSGEAFFRTIEANWNLKRVTATVISSFAAEVDSSWGSAGG